MIWLDDLFDVTVLPVAREHRFLPRVFEGALDVIKAPNRSVLEIKANDVWPGLLWDRLKLLKTTNRDLWFNIKSALGYKIKSG